MRWSNILVIFRREVRDQLRDRRTLFMVFMLPVLLYPMLGIGVAQLSVAFEQKPRTVIVVGTEYLPQSPPLLNQKRDGFNPDLFESVDGSEVAHLRVKTEPDSRAWKDPEGRRLRLRSHEADAVFLIPSDIRAQIHADKSISIPTIYDSADERSQLTYLRVDKVISQWKSLIVNNRLKRDRKPASYTEPVRTKPIDIATAEESGGSIWAKIFPFLLVLMSLTGAFYPAVDLCAGEKERGTMETLLISPASRAEIVIGKFLTVMLASMATAVLNLGSMALTGMQLANQFGAIGVGPASKIDPIFRMPTFTAGFWMVLLLIPLSAFFSALCVALAVLARSMKEGQYYMTPLYLFALPLIFATLSPAVELDLFTSLVPITGVALLLKVLMSGDYATARLYFVPVLLPTTAYGAIALRWAVDQFQRESVLFREAERFDLVGWVRHLIRDREPIPNTGAALLCFAFMISASYFTMQLASGFTTTAQILMGQVLFILGPPLLMSLLITSSPRRTLRLRFPEPRFLGLALGLAVAINPLTSELRHNVEHLFPIPELIKQVLAKMFGGLQFGEALLLLGVVPAICEEFAFRGFILSGLEHDYRPRTAIVLSAFLFAFLHVLLSVFHQFFNAALLGIVLGLLAVRSGSILPGILFHLMNNGLALVIGRVSEGKVGSTLTAILYRSQAEGLYHYHWVALGGLASAWLFVILYRGYPSSSEPAAIRADPLAAPG
jgi:sodium transport system permease protein